jgi:hypothetical protein
MFKAALFTTVKLWTQPKCPSTDEWIKKMWCRNTMEYHSAIENNEIMTLAGKWAELQISMLSEISQTRKDRHHMFLEPRTEHVT